MSSFFYNLGRKAGHTFSRGQWWYKSLFGTEKEALQAEYMIGRQIAENIDHHFNQNLDEKLQYFIDSIGLRLTSKLINKQQIFHFQILSNTQLNAFALPGSFIYCTNSLIQFCQLDKDEISFILAHEIAHVVKKHPFKRVLANSSFRMLSNLGKTSSILGNITKQTIEQLFQNGYSQNQESEADRFAIQMMTVAGFDPNNAIHFLEKLKGTTSNEDSFSIYFSSHPAYNERIRTLKEMIKRKSSW